MESGEWRVESGEWRVQNREWRMERRDIGVLFCDNLYPPSSKTQYLWDLSLRRLFAWVLQGDP